MLHSFYPLAVSFFVLSLAGCVSTPPKHLDNLCHIFDEKDGWYKDAKRASKKWNIPIATNMAFMYTKNTPRDWADIKLFLAIHDCGSLVAASEALGLTQPTVGRRLAAMEERLGTPLFVRAGRRMQLTEAGAGILEGARRMEREMLAIERSLDVHSTALCGEVTISATEGTGTDWLSPVLLDFHRQYPDIVIKMHIDGRPVDLLHREADLALRLGRPTQPALIARHLANLGFGLYASPEYLRRAGTPESVGELGAHDMVGLDMRNRQMSIARAFPEE